MRLVSHILDPLLETSGKVPDVVHIGLCEFLCAHEHERQDRVHARQWQRFVHCTPCKAPSMPSGKLSWHRGSTWICIGFERIEHGLPLRAVYERRGPRLAPDPDQALLHLRGEGSRASAPAGARRLLCPLIHTVQLHPLRTRTLAPVQQCFCNEDAYTFTSYNICHEQTVRGQCMGCFVCMGGLYAYKGLPAGCRWGGPEGQRPSRGSRTAGPHPPHAPLTAALSCNARHIALSAFTSLKPPARCTQQVAPVPVRAHILKAAPLLLRIPPQHELLACSKASSISLPFSARQ